VEPQRVGRRKKERQPARVKLRKGKRGNSGRQLVYLNLEGAAERNET